MYTKHQILCMFLNVSFHLFGKTSKYFATISLARTCCKGVQILGIFSGENMSVAVRQRQICSIWYNNYISTVYYCVPFIFRPCKCWLFGAEVMTGNLYFCCYSRQLSIILRTVFDYVYNLRRRRIIWETKWQYCWTIQYYRRARNFMFLQKVRRSYEMIRNELTNNFRGADIHKMT